MKRELLFVLPSPFRDEFRIQGFRFGSGQKSIAIVGAMRGDELQQQFVCSQLVSTPYRRRSRDTGHPLGQSLCDEHRQALLGHGQYGHQPYVPGLQPG